MRQSVFLENLPQLPADFKESKLEDEKRTVFCMSKDASQGLQSTMYLLLELYQTVMASLLVLLVPQKCSSTSHSSSQCSFDDSVDNSRSHFEIFVVVWNFLTLGWSLVLYWDNFTRERYFIRYFDASSATAGDRLGEIIHLYPHLGKFLYQLNMRTCVTAAIAAVFYIVNIIVSGIIVLARSEPEITRCCAIHTHTVALNE